LSPKTLRQGDAASLESLLALRPSEGSRSPRADGGEDRETTQVMIVKTLTHENTASRGAIDALKRDFEVNALMASIAPEFFARPTFQVVHIVPEAFLRDLLRGHRPVSLSLAPPKVVPSAAILVEDLGAVSLNLFCKSLPETLKGPSPFSRSVLTQLTNIRLPFDHLLIDPVSLDFFLHLALRMTRSLLHLHNAGFLHNDVKSANFLVHPLSHRLWLIDFHACSTWKRVFAPSSASSLFSDSSSSNAHLIGTP